MQSTITQSHPCFINFDYSIRFAFEIQKERRRRFESKRCRFDVNNKMIYGIFDGYQEVMICFLAKFFERARKHIFS